MRSSHALSLLLAPLFAAGCVSTINPLFSPDIVRQNASIEGVWFRVDDVTAGAGPKNESLSIRPDHDGDGEPEDGSAAGYLMTLDTPQTSETMQAKLVELGGCQFLDVYSITELLRPDVIPVHNILRIALAEDELLVAQVDRTKFEKILKTENVELAVARVGRRLVLTGSTAELQGFFATHSERVFGAERRYRKSLPPKRN